MSEQMLLGILRTPYPDDNIVLASQFIAAARQAADEIERLRAENQQLASQVETLTQQIRSERRVRWNNSDAS